jgi:hypothetical protein
LFYILREGCGELNKSLYLYFLFYFYFGKISNFCQSSLSLDKLTVFRHAHKEGEAGMKREDFLHAGHPAIHPLPTSSPHVGDLWEDIWAKDGGLYILHSPCARPIAHSPLPLNSTPPLTLSPSHIKPSFLLNFILVEEERNEGLME